MCRGTPSLLQGSSMLVYIYEFNSNPKMLTTTLSPLIAKNCNADFDGDFDGGMLIRR